MAVKTTIRTPMPIKQRAKQFMMFDAMKGLTEAIAEKEYRNYPRRELSDERITEIGLLLSSLQAGSMVDITYYCSYSHRYKKVVGVVSKLDQYWKQILIDDIVIDFCDIYDIAADMDDHLVSN